MVKENVRDRYDYFDATFYGQPSKYKQCDDPKFHANLANAKMSQELELLAPALCTITAFIPKCWLILYSHQWDETYHKSLLKILSVWL